MTKRWTMRVAPQADELVRRAAATLDVALSGFVVVAAIAEAERVLAAQTRFTLDRIDWARLAALLDRPPRHAAGLELLFSQPSVFSRV